MSVSDLAIVAALVFGWGTLSARLERFDVTAPITFGAVAVAPAVDVLTWQIVLYAVLSLTVIRMAPVAVTLVAAGLDRATIALVGWFGPRGLASVVFCLLALEELGSPAADHAAAVITITVSGIGTPIRSKAWRWVAPGGAQLSSRRPRRPPGTCRLMLS